jgi:hypothetical protein
MWTAAAILFAINAVSRQSKDDLDSPIDQRFDEYIRCGHKRTFFNFETTSVSARAWISTRKLSSPAKSHFRISKTSRPPLLPLCHL